MQGPGDEGEALEDSRAFTHLELLALLAVPFVFRFSTDPGNTLPLCSHIVERPANRALGYPLADGRFTARVDCRVRSNFILFVPLTGCVIRGRATSSPTSDCFSYKWTLISAAVRFFHVQKIVLLRTLDTTPLSP